MLSYEQLCLLCPVDNCEKTVQWCQNQKLIAIKNRCFKCMIFMYKVKTKRYKCGFGFQCHKCKTLKPITVNSFFHASNLDVAIQLRILHLMSQSRLHTEIQDELQIDYKTVVNFGHRFRELISNFVNDNPVKLGNNGATVEVDESLFGKQKYHRGRVVKGHWVLGAVEKESKMWYLKSVDKRNKETLEHNLKDCIVSGAVVHTDGWPAYRNLNRSLGVTHKVVNHNQNFKDSVTGACINECESGWTNMKNKYKRMKGTVDKHFSSHLNEALWRANNIGFKSDMRLSFAKLLEIIANNYLFE